ncbi:hypothetical protein [Agromyces sp. NPDC058110]|uniref:hypothetical protein n=1 Tax=Agromyces sp. NPDC058110 TaxID=3346345 RepID=UPI0036DC2F6C
MVGAKALGSILAASAVVALLAGCAPSATGAEPSVPAETTAAAAAPTPTPAPPTEPTEPVDPLTSVTKLVATATSLDLVDADGGLVERYAYLDDPESVLGALSAVFDGDPVTEDRPGSNHYPPSRAHVWGDVEIEVRAYDEARREAEGIGLSWPRFAVYFDAPSYDGVELTTPSGIQVGDEFGALEAGLDPDDWTCSGPGVDTETVTEYSEHEGGMVEHEYGVVLRDAVGAAAPADGAVVIWVGAPYAIADGCA